jgi:hypothetical protein
MDAGDHTPKQHVMEFSNSPCLARDIQLERLSIVSNQNQQYHHTPSDN